jgi:hypothetical protein
MPLVVALAAGILYGTVTLGPLTPVCRVGTPCDGPARGATLDFVGAGGRTVAARTDSAGRFRVRLAAGTWVVHASVGMAISPREVVVSPGARRVAFAIDTGIR